MNQFDVFRNLAAAARLDTPPPLDVSQQVIYRINAMEDEGIDRPLAWLTATSLFAACASAAVASTLFGGWAEPMGALVQLTPILGL